MPDVMNKISIEQHTLHNGATLLYKHFPGSPRLAISIYVPGGNLLDPVPGLSDVVDRLLMKGTTKLNQEEISIEIDSLTLEVDTDTRRDYSAMYATLLEEDLESSLGLMSDLFFHSTLDEFEREKEKLAGEILMELDAPKNRASDLLIRTLFETTAYGVVSSVVQDSLPKMDSIEQAFGYYRKAYQPKRLVFSVAGDISLDRVKSALDQYFPQPSTMAAVKTEGVIKTLQNLSIPKNQTVTFARDDSTQAHIYQGWLMPEVGHADYYPLAVMNTILGAAGLSSRLFLELRDKQGLAYNVRSTLDTYSHKGVFYLYIGTEPSNKQKCLDGFRDECAKLMKERVSDKELDDAKRNILGRRSVYLETAPQLANYIGANFVMGRTLEEIEKLASNIQKVTAAEIQRVAEHYLSQPSITSIVGPSAIL